MSEDLWLSLTARPNKKNEKDSKTVKRKLLYLTTIILTLAGCSSEDYVGNEELHEVNENGRPVTFNLIAAPKTRAVGGSDAADMLNNSFVVYAQKKFTSPASTQKVFDNYLVQYADNSASTTTSNSAGWEYVGYYNLPNGKITGHAGIPTATTGRVEQSIKYWDFSADHYEFLAYSLGKGDKPEDSDNTKYANATALYYDDKTSANDPSDDDYTGYKYKLTGSADQLQACYISNLEKVAPSYSNTQVQLKFRKLESKVRIALYETIPGYSVNDVKFYQSASVESGAAEGYGNTAYLYGSADFIHTDGSFTVTYIDDPNSNSTSINPSLTWEAGDDHPAANLSFGNTTGAGSTWTGWASQEYREDENLENPGSYLGRTSNTATMSDYQYVLPNPSNTANLNLKIDYTLVSRDGYGEEIKVKGVTAAVPATYAQWLPNYSYTYIFKITDENLYPITLDAIVTQNVDGKQETITTVSEPSITTFGVVNNKYSVGKSEYEAGADIYATIVKGNEVMTPVLSGADANVKVYRVAYKSGATAEQIAANPITETNVANSIAMEGVSGLIQATAYTTGVSVVNSVPGEDGSTKKLDEDETVKKALKLQSVPIGTYAIQYKYKDASDIDQYVYKIVRVQPSISVYQAPNGFDEVDEYAAGSIYVLLDNGSTSFTSTPSQNTWLYTVSMDQNGSSSEAPAEITQATAAEAATNLSTGAVDDNGWRITFTKVAGGFLNASTSSIPDTDISFTGANKVGVFTGAAGTTYVFEYIYTDPADNTSKKFYRVIKVASGS